MSTHCDHLKSAKSHVHQAAEAMGDHLLPREVRHHLRNAAKHALLAGVAALDAAEQRSAGHAAHSLHPAGHAAPSEHPAAPAMTPAPA